MYSHDYHMGFLYQKKKVSYVWGEIAGHTINDKTTVASLHEQVVGWALGGGQLLAGITGKSLPLISNPERYQIQSTVSAKSYEAEKS